MHATPLFLTTIVALHGAAVSILAEVEGTDQGWVDYGTSCQHGKHFGLAEASGLDAAIDDATGRDLRTFPPDRVVDLVHLKLQMRFEDLNEPQFTATETLRFAVLGREAKAVTLNAVGLDIGSVRLDGQPIEHYHDGETITLYFDPPLPVGSEHAAEFLYTCERPAAGMIFTPQSQDFPQATAEVHTQGQTETNRHWFITRDFPNDRLTSELIVNVPAEYSVSGNGRKVTHLVSGDRATWHWLQDKPHVSYLVSMVIGRFDIVELRHPRVPMHVWVPEGLGDRVGPTYGRTGAMIDCFEDRFGIPYPWARYDQLVVKNFAAGGMENTSATTMYPTALFDDRAFLDGDLDSLIAHELAHQWTGDLITCKSWEHIWLNEGWATYGSALWFEQRDGEDGYLDSIRRSFRVARRDKTSGALPMVSPIYANPWETFRRAGNPYSKGSSILHMLRRMLGDEVFFEGVHLYMNRHAGGLVETSDFRYALEEASGLGLEWFFEQWCERPGCPQLEVDVRFDAEDRLLRIDVEQVQQIDARTPAFRFTLPVQVMTFSGVQLVEIDVTERSTSFQIELSAVPEVVAIDPYLDVLKTIEVTKPLPMWVAQVQRGTTIAARHAAVEALGEHDTPEVVRLLAALAGDEAVRHTLRGTAVESLSGLGSDQARAAMLELVTGDIEDARVRAKCMTAAGELDQADVVETLIVTAEQDESYATRVEAIRALAKHESTEHVERIAALVHYPSQHQQVRQAALKAMAKLDEEEGLELAMQYAAFGQPDRARAVAMQTVGDLAHHDPDTAVAFLAAHLDDPERRTAEAAADGLAKTKHEDAVAPLQAVAKSHPNERFRERAEKLVKELQESLE